MKESEQKSLSEARGYVPMIAPQPAMPVMHSRPTAVDSSLASTSGVRGVAREQADGPVEAKTSKEKESSTKAGETGE